MTMQLSSSHPSSRAYVRYRKEGGACRAEAPPFTLLRPLGGMIPLGHLRLTSCLRTVEEVNRVLTQVIRSIFVCLLSPVGDTEK